MLLTVDIGNTNIGAAIFDKNNIINVVKTPSLKNKNDDYYSSIFFDLFKNYPIKNAVIGSVVSELSSPVKNALQKIIPNIFVVSSETYCGLKIKKQTKYKKGADILATSCAANTLYGDSIVIDAGTATTLQIIKNREFLGYIIAPGLSMCAKALHYETSLLPLVDTPKNPACWGNNTIEAIQTGTFYGHALMIDALISEIEKKAKHKFKTIATGGNIPKLLNLMKRPFDVIDYELIFKGLKLIYNLNHEKTF